MNLKQLELFLAVAEVGSFSKAAAECYVSQSTVSTQIRELEQELGARLFTRSTRSVQLSSEGKRLYEDAKQLLEMKNKIEKDFGIAKEKRSRHLRIGASSIPALYLLPEILSDFRKKYPDKKVVIRESDSEGVIRQVVDKEVDIGFVGTRLRKAGLRYIPFYLDELVFITPNEPKYQKLQQRKKADLQWILEENFILRERGSGTRKEAEKALQDSGFAMENLQITGSMDNQEMIKRSVELGMGISVLSSLAVDREVEQGKLLSFSFQAEHARRNIYLVYNKNQNFSEEAHYLIKRIESQYKL